MGVRHAARAFVRGPAKRNRFEPRSMTTRDVLTHESIVATRGCARWQSRQARRSATGVDALPRAESHYVVIRSAPPCAVVDAA